MPHDVTLIATIASAFGLALILGYVAARLRLPPLVGYLAAGIVVGPFTPGYVADIGLAGQLAEIGVMLLMFGVGLHFSISDLMAVKRIAVPGAIVQIATATAMGAVLAQWWGWSLGAGVVFGLCLSVASTVVLLKALEVRGQLQSVNGQIAVGWLVVEDLVMVIVLVLLPALAQALGSESTQSGSASVLEALFMTLGKVVAFIALMLVIGKRVLPKMLWLIAQTHSKELFTLSVVAVALGVAFGAAKLFDVSFALGAFFAGVVIRESEFSHRAAEESAAFRDAFAVLFFVSVGMLFDPSVIWREPWKLLGTVAVVMLGKTVAAIALTLLFRYPLNTAMTVGVSLAQIGEFSFILAGLGVALAVLPPEGQSLVLAAAFISIAANSALFALIEPARAFLLERSALARQLEHADDPLAALPRTTEERLLHDQVVLLGYGRIGQAIADQLRAAGLPFVIAEQNRELVEHLRDTGQACVVGDAATPEVLIQAHVSQARLLIIAIPDMVGVRSAIDIARELNPGIQILVRSHNAEEAQMLRDEGVGEVFLPEDSLARAMANRALALSRS
jgi:CPA2 family monovalent cation:H+ antiporter-2